MLLLDILHLVIARLLFTPFPAVVLPLFQILLLITSAFTTGPASKLTPCRPLLFISQSDTRRLEFVTSVAYLMLIPSSPFSEMCVSVIAYSPIMVSPFPVLKYIPCEVLALMMQLFNLPRNPALPPLLVPGSATKPYWLLRRLRLAAMRPSIPQSARPA